jgi:hypothetical protein
MTDPLHWVDPLPGSEREIRDLLMGGIPSLFPNVTVSVETKSHGRARTDLAFLASGELIGVEVKRTDWRRAIAQAFLNRCCVDRSYVALWCSKVRPAVLDEACRWGIGVLAVGPRRVEECLPAVAARPDSTVRARMIASLDTGGVP